MSAVDRWHPSRAGVVNLYEYADQVFEFGDGRLLLRGHNTSGKTKALELLLPFCLDGDISPRKLDPFASDAKDMRWNLVGCIEQEQRIGYAWLEFERRDETGDLRHFTCGVGLRANRNVPGVTRWYFVARDLRVGLDVSLLRGREPIGKADLDAELGDAGEVLDSQRAYRARLDDLLFGFGSEEQYRSMLRLMLELRRPHLSKTLDPDRVADLLSAGLPELDPELMRKLAGGLEQLEALERQLERLRQVRERVRSFHERTYRAYLRAVVRERADRLRSAQTAVDATGARLRDVGARRERASARRAALDEERAAVATEIERLEGAERALVTSQAWRSIEAVEALRDQAEAHQEKAGALTRIASDAVAAATVAEAEQVAGRAAANEAAAAFEQELTAAASVAARAGLEKSFGALAAQLRDGGLEPGAWADLVRDGARDRQAVLREHEQLVDDSRTAGREAERHRQNERDAAAALASAAQRTEVAREALEVEQATLWAAASRWRESASELTLDDDQLEAAVARALDGHDPGAVLAAAAEPARTALAAETAHVAAQTARAREERAQAETEIRALEADRDDGPAAPSWSRADRSNRSGAALWQLVDVAAGADGTDVANVEAALVAMGILDAWVLPDGRVLDRATQDVVLTAGPPAPGRTLADLLVPAPGDRVPSAVVSQVLRRIALMPDALAPAVAVRDATGASAEVANTATAAVDVRGGFRLGPLSGSSAKATAEHLGAAARAARRARLLAVARTRLAQLEELLTMLAAEAEALSGRRETLAAEVAGFPPRDAVIAALRAVDVSAAAERAADQAHERAAAAARVAGDEQIAAEARTREHAAAHALLPGLDAAQLAVLREAAAELLGLAGGVATICRHAAASRERAEACSERLRAARELSDARATEAAAARADAERLAAEHATRAASLGDEAERIRDQHANVVSELRERRRRRETLDHEHSETVREEAVVEAEERMCTSRHAGSREERAAASERFASLGTADVLALVLGDDSPDDLAAAADWSFTRVLEVARQLPARLLEVRASSADLAVDVMRRVQELDRQLADADLSAFASRDADNLLLVRIAEGAAERSLAHVLQSLEDEIADREQVLSAEERRVFSDALVEELADHLRARIHAVHERVAHMNAVLRRTPTAAGKVVQLEWRAVDDQTGEQRAVVELLRRRIRDVDSEARGRLVAFLRGRAEASRAQDVGTDATMAETLAAAFDYRRWFAFGLMEERDGRRERLTRRRHAVGSGGEQSVLIHLPLFAAAAVLYGDGTSPRLVMLDEALSGIDDDTRERVLAATVALDLDVVMTSHELWGTYASVPRLAIYQLHRENGVFGVHTVPFLWDGALLHEGRQAELAA
jgi:uncharacterized protein (TIGR02680 family)